MKINDGKNFLNFNSPISWNMSGRFAWATAMKISINFARYSLNMQYRIYLCISRPPILEPEKVFLINVLEKLIFYHGIFFQVHSGYTKNLS